MGPYCSSLLQDAPVQDHRVHPYILVRCHRSHQMVQGRDHSHLNNLDHPIHLLGLVHVRRILRCILGLDPVILNLDPLTHRSGLGRAPHTLQLTRVPSLCSLIMILEWSHRIHPIARVLGHHRIQVRSDLRPYRSGRSGRSSPTARKKGMNWSSQ